MNKFIVFAILAASLALFVGARYVDEETQERALTEQQTLELLASLDEETLQMLEQAVQNMTPEEEKATGRALLGFNFLTNTFKNPADAWLVNLLLNMVNKKTTTTGK